MTIGELVTFLFGAALGVGFSVTWGHQQGMEKQRLILRAKVSDECGKEAAQRVFGEKSGQEGR